MAKLAKRGFKYTLVFTSGYCPGYAIGYCRKQQNRGRLGKDSSRIVIDEVAGVLVTMLFIPKQLFLLIAGFVVFRLVDNIKPFYIKRLENLPGGTGVMADDLLAGVYSNVILWLIYSVSPLFVHT